jgi:tetratricopeptide (TPR) repeat protein
MFRSNERNLAVFPWSTAIAAALLVAFGASPISALTDEDWSSCARAGGLSVDLPIRGCTAVIEAGERMLVQLVAAYNNRGVAFRSNGQIDRAIEDYDQAIRLKPEYYVAINNRGVAFLNKGDLDRAIADFDRTIQLKPDHFTAFHNRAVALGRKGLFERAIADYDVIIKIDPHNSTFLHERGTMKAKTGDQHSADADFRRADSIDRQGRRGAERPK